MTSEHNVNAKVRRFDLIADTNGDPPIQYIILRVNIDMNLEQIKSKLKQKLNIAAGGHEVFKLRNKQGHLLPIFSLLTESNVTIDVTKPNQTVPVKQPNAASQENQSLYMQDLFRKVKDVMVVLPPLPESFLRRNEE